MKFYLVQQQNMRNKYSFTFLLVVCRSFYFFLSYSIFHSNLFKCNVNITLLDKTWTDWKTGHKLSVIWSVFTYNIENSLFNANDWMCLNVNTLRRCKLKKIKWKLSSWWKISQITVYCRFQNIVTIADWIWMISMNGVEYIYICIYNIASLNWSTPSEMWTTIRKTQYSIFLALFMKRTTVNKLNAK